MKEPEGSLKKKVWIPQLLVVLVLLCFPDRNHLPQYLAFSFFAYLSFVAYKRGRQGWLWILTLTSIAYSPILGPLWNLELPGLSFADRIEKLIRFFESPKTYGGEVQVEPIALLATLGIAVGSVFAFNREKVGTL